jgi:hypothetical protein
MEQEDSILDWKWAQASLEGLTYLEAYFKNHVQNPGCEFWRGSHQQSGGTVGDGVCLRVNVLLQGSPGADRGSHWLLALDRAPGQW